MGDRFDKLFTDLDSGKVKRKSKSSVDFSEAGFNPFIYYGVGVNNFAKMNSRLVLLFAFLAMMALIQMIVFRSFNGLGDYAALSPVANWSFGGMGYPTYLCRRNLIDWSEQTIDLNFHCQGRTEITEVLSSGVMSYEDSEDYPGLSIVFGQCYYDPEGYSARYFKYMQYFDSEAFNQEFLRKCEGKTDCRPSMSLSSITIPEAERTQG